jgi:ABC-type antimicrobial peptide transport system permease subunit
MILNNFLISFRNIKRNKGTFFINLIGLSSGLACAILIYLWVNDELNFDKFHKKDNQLFQVMVRNKVSNGTEISSATSSILANTLVEELPEVEYALTAGPPDQKMSMLSFEDKMIKAVVMYAGRDFFNVFSFNLLDGNENQVLSDRNNIAISEEIAMKLFNTKVNIVGKAIEFDSKNKYIISGVFKGTPQNSSIQFDVVLPFDVMKKKFPGIDAWGQNYFNTFLILKAGTNFDQFDKKIGEILKKKTDSETSSLFIKPFSEQYLYGKYINGVQAGGRIEYVKLFSLIAIFILVIACINFMNLSTARASLRIKEVGIKKSFGANRRSLVFRFMGESMLMAFLSLLVAIYLVILFIPQFNEITGKSITLNFNKNLVVSFLGITSFAGFVSGSYPALFLSSFSPAVILKGTANNSRSELWIRKGLVIFQFTLSVILIVSVLVVYKQIEFIQKKNPGFDRDNVIYFEKEGQISNNLDTFISEAKNIPGVTNASCISWNLVGNQGSTDGMKWKGKNPADRISFYLQYIDYDLIETFGIEMKEGRSFSRDFDQDQSKIIFNETAVKIMGFKNPIGEIVNLWGYDRQIVGVTNDFNFESLHKQVKPSFFLLSSNNSQIIVKIHAGTEKVTIPKLEKLYQEYNPGFLLDFKFLDQDYQEQYVAEKRVANLSRNFAWLAVLISCLGLFGLAAFSAERRIKEIGLRKINGASSLSVICLLSSDFIKIILVSISIALPISYLITKSWLDSFAYKTELSWWIFCLAGIIVLTIALLTVSLQTWRAATKNPVDALRYE